MGTWTDTYPADTLNANTLHTILQTAKGLLSERMKATNPDAWDEHLVCQASEDGLHIPSRTGFAGVWTTWVNRPTDAPMGSLQYIKAGGEQGVYVILSDLSYQRCAVDDHDLLSDLDDDDCHAIYGLRGGSRAMTGTLTLGAAAEFTNITFGTEIDSPLNPTHVAETFYAAHGADSIVDRHIVSIAVSAMSRSTDYFPSGQKCYFSNTARIYGWPRSARAPDSVARAYIGNDGTPYFFWQYGTVNSYFPFVNPESTE